MVTGLHEPAGLGWRIVSAFPETAFTGHLAQNLRQTLGLALAVSALFIGLALALATSFAARFLEFSGFARAIAQGNWRRSADRPRSFPVAEFEGLRRDLLSMSGELEGAFTRLEDEVEERRQTELSLLESQRAYNRLAARIPVGVFILRTSPKGGFSFDFVSPRFRQIFGLGPEEPVTGPETYLNLIHPEDRRSFLLEQEDAIRENRHFAWEGRILVEGQVRYIRKVSTPEIEESGEVVWDGLLADITEARLAEARIKTLLSEKELLLKEVHHRIKNNMNTIVSMLSLQADLQGDRRVAVALGEARDRLMSMMLLYDRLYRSEKVSEADAAAYLDEIATMVASQNSLRAGISIERELAPCILGTRLLMPLGIIANELLVNAYKHAFPGDRGGRVSLLFRVEGERALLAVADNGVGTGAGPGGSGFGRTLVEGLALQMGGSLKTESGETGTRVELSFPLED
jgi:PAS domain S-box-containing protein